jgi:PAS domain S-box-containing protein
MRLRGLNFDHHIAALQQRITALRWNILQGRTQKERAILQAFEELQTALEELHTVDEELHLQSEVLCQQNEALTAAHQMLDVERQHYQSLFDFAPDGYLVTDGTGTICEANQTACAMLDLPQDMLKNQPLLAFVVHDDAQLFSTQLQQLQRLPQMQNWEMRLQPRLGSSFPASVRVGPARHAEGEPPNLLWLLRDISERQQLEQALRESEQRFRAVFDQAAVGMAVFGMDGKWLQVNQQFCDFVGYSAEELLEQRWQQTTHPDDVAAGVGYMGRLLAGDMPAYVREKRYITKHGTEVWGKLSVSLVRDASCTPKYWIDVVEDITARKIAEVQAQQAAHALQSSRERNRSGTQN